MLFLLLTACGPSSGNYTFTLVGEKSDCPDDYAGMADPGGDQTITVESATEITLEGNPSTACSLDGMLFDCPFEEIDATQDYSDQGLEAVYFIDAEMSGEWLTSTTLEGTMSIDTSCEGADCQSVIEAGAPECKMSWDFEGSL